ncbi:MAG: AsmA family protein, partial [Gammaproteobacteria bacterium]|nr:AsmA family protein [Gammaproteobacteria bacterium]
AELDIVARADSLAELRKAFGEAVPAVGKTKLQPHLNLKQARLKLSKLAVSLGASRIDGWATLDMSGPKPDLQTELAFSDLDLDKLMPAKDETPDAKPAKAKVKDRVLPDDALPFESLSRANVQARLRATNLLYNNRRLKHADIDIKLKDGRLTTSLLKLSPVRGELLGDLVVDASGSKTPAITVKLKAADIDLGELLATADGKSPIEGPLTIDIDLQGQGSSIAGILGGLNGHAKLLAEQGSADATALEALDLFVGGLGAMVGTIFTEQSDKTAIHCAICELKFDKGLMTSELALLDTQYSTVFIDGQANLKNEQLDLKVSPEAKGVTLSVAFPVLVKGQFAKPNIDVDKTGALIKTGELWATVAYPPAALVKFDDLTGDGKHNPCVSMVAEKGGIPFMEDVGKAVKGTVKATGKVVEGTVEGTGKVVGGTVEGTGKVVEGTVEGTEKVVKGVGGVLKDTGSGLGKIFGRKEGDADTGGDVPEEEVDDFDMDY